MGGLGRDMLAAGHHLQRLFDADDARQALGAAGAGQEADIDLRQAGLGRRDGDTIVRHQRHLQTPAQGGAVDRRDHRLGRVLDDVLDVLQGRTGHGLAELGDVGAGDEGLAVADQHDRLDRRVGDGGLEGALQPLADHGRQGVDRRRVQRDDADVAFHGEISDGVDRGHAASTLALKLISA